MLTQPQVEPTAADVQRRSAKNPYVGGMFLILLGVFMLFGQLTQWNFSWTVLVALAAFFLLWGLLTRTFGLLIPGSILAGVALGAGLTESLLPLYFGSGSAGVFLLSFSAGWALMALLSVFTEGGFRWWPLVPGGIIAAVGAALMAGPQGLQLLSYMNYVWPLALMGLGVFLLLRRNR